MMAQIYSDLYGVVIKLNTTQNCIERLKEADNYRIIDRIRSVSCILHTLLGVDILWKLQIQPDIASDSTYGEIRYK